MLSSWMVVRGCHPNLAAELGCELLSLHFPKSQTWNERQKVPHKVLGITNEDNRKEGGKEKT